MKAQARTHGAGVTGAIECRYYGRDFTAGEMACCGDRRTPPLVRHAVEGVLPAHRLVQARGGLGHDGQGRHAGHRDGLRPPARRDGRTGPGRGLGAPKRRCSRPRRPSTVARLRPVMPAPGRQALERVRRSCISDTRRSAPRCATPSTGRLAARCSASPPPRGSSARQLQWTRQLREKNLPFVVGNPDS